MDVQRSMVTRLKAAIWPQRGEEMHSPRRAEGTLKASSRNVQLHVFESADCGGERRVSSAACTSWTFVEGQPRLRFTRQTDAAISHGASAFTAFTSILTAAPLFPRQPAPTPRRGPRQHSQTLLRIRLEPARRPRFFQLAATRRQAARRIRAHDCDCNFSGASLFALTLLALGVVEPKLSSAVLSCPGASGATSTGRASCE